MIQQFFTTQVQEIRLTQQETDQIILENVRLRAKISGYDFDHQKPIVVHLPSGGVSYRFVQSFMLKDSSPSDITLEPLSKYKKAD